MEGEPAAPAPAAGQYAPYVHVAAAGGEAGSAVHNAARSGDVDALKRLTGQDWNVKDAVGRTPLFVAGQSRPGWAARPRVRAAH